MFTGIFTSLIVEILAFLGIAICATIAAVITILAAAIVVWFIIHAIKVLKDEFKPEEKTDDTRKQQPKSK